MAGSRAYQLSLLDDERLSAFCVYGQDFMSYRGKIVEGNLFDDFMSGIQKCIFMDQIHSNIVEFIDDFEINQDLKLSCDGLVSTQKGVALCVLSADCLPVLLWHKKGIIAALHSGRKGCFENILKVAVLGIKKRFKDIKNEDFKLFIAPSICVKNYEISGEVLDHAKKHFNAFLKDNHLDLKALLKAQANELGITDIKDSGICSFDDERFFSYRKNATMQRFVSVIVLK
ncbi:laccase [Campylobacter sp. MIT 99-7217]|uniref:polyphenol oxidase family protein n=1 Tax=Campylobacter sp. MIT 99-7217 TaxID=535091 RepID=UPI00115722B2|nr:laccase domain-containing protein [Campylobacter sp. MIT 99-7217]TQR29190.1 laccase [Campylobacter sp. MIT 99-7217]